MVLPLAVRERRPAPTGTFRTDSTDVLDRYILAKTHDLVADVTAQHGRVRPRSAPAARCATFLDALTNWYVRRSRDRFWAGDQDAIDTLHTVLVDALPGRGAAAAAGHRGGLPRPHRRAQRAPHRLAVGRRRPRRRATRRQRWTSPATCASPRCALRKAHQRRVRLPLASLHGRGRRRRPRSPPFTDLHRRRGEREGGRAHRRRRRGAPRYDLQVVPAALGPRLGGQTQQVIKAVKAGDWQRDRRRRRGRRRRRCCEGEYTLKLVVAGRRRQRAAVGSATAWWCSTPTVTPELEAEGVARDLVRLVQQARRDAGLAGQRPHRAHARRARVASAVRWSRSSTCSPRPPWRRQLAWAARRADAELDGEPVHIAVAVAGCTSGSGRARTRRCRRGRARRPGRQRAPRSSGCTATSCASAVCSPPVDGRANDELCAVLAAVAGPAAARGRRSSQVTPAARSNCWCCRPRSRRRGRRRRLAPIGQRSRVL